MLSANDLVARAVGKPFKFVAATRISRGGAMAGFAEGVQVYSGPIFGWLDDDALTLKTCSAALANGTFVQYHDNEVTTGSAITGGFLVSDRFGGCDFTLLRSPTGALHGAHVFHESADRTTRGLLAALPEGWTRVGSWSSGPTLAQWGANMSLLAFAFPQGPRVEIVVLGVCGWPVRVARAERVADFPIAA